MRRLTWPCNALTALARRESLRPTHGHAKCLAFVVRFDPAEAHELLQRDSKLIAQRAQVLFDQAGVEAVVSGGHRRMRGEDCVLRDFAQGVVEA